MSLLEVSEASTLIQEAAHEEANIIFGAVVDEELAGRVKITVIATGFDRVSSSRMPAANNVQTPVDLSHYAVRTRAEPLAPAAVRQTIVRRPSIDLPAPRAVAAGAEDQVVDELESPLDVPAFLRQREG
jgi:cell division protein FtsZ